MIPSLSIGPRTLLNDYNHCATAIFWRSAILLSSQRWRMQRTRLQTMVVAPKAGQSQMTKKCHGTSLSCRVSTSANSMH